MAVIRNYLSLIKFSHTVFALPFALVGFFMAIKYLMIAPLIGDDDPIANFISPLFPGQVINVEGNHVIIPLTLILFKLTLVIMCMIFVRSAAMAFNRYLDRHFDALNPRTAFREIPAGIISANNSLILTIICSLLFVFCCWFINPLCFYLSPLALFVVLGYSYTKRFTPLSHLILGLGLSLAPIGAYLAVTGKFALIPVLLSAAVLLWVSGFDIIYALQDEEFDRQYNLHSIPEAVGKQKALRISEILHATCSLLLLYIYAEGNFGWWYFIGWLIFLFLLVYQHAMVKLKDLSNINVAFMTTNGIASVVFSIFVIVDLFIHKLPG